MSDKKNPPAQKTELKTERVQLLMAPSEVKAVDDYGFSHRIRTRAQVIRHLLLEGMVTEHAEDYAEALAACLTEILQGKMDPESFAKVLATSEAYTEASNKRLAYAEELQDWLAVRSASLQEAHKVATRLQNELVQSQEEASQQQTKEQPYPESE